MSGYTVQQQRPVVVLFSEAVSARTATGNSATLPSSGYGVCQAWVTVNVTVVSGTTPTLTLALQQQDANGVWVAVGQTASLTAVGTASFNVGPDLPLVGPLRVAWTIGGTTPSFTFQASVQAR